MTTLTGNITSPIQNYIAVSDPPGDVVFWTIDSENIIVTGWVYDGPQESPLAKTLPRWIIQRAVGGTTATTHSSGATLTPYYPDAPGGGSSPTLADVLMTSADTGGIVIVNAPDTGNANVSRTATATGDDNADAQTTAHATGDGNADGRITATADGGGNATATANANAADGAANASIVANSTTWRARADASAYGANNASANNNATTVDGAATALVNAAATGAGTAQAWLLASGGNDAHVVSIEVNATATGATMTITGLPTSDPGNAGQLYTNGTPSAGVPKALMVSGG